MVGLKSISAIIQLAVILILQFFVVTDEVVLEIRSGPNSQGTKFDIDLLW